MLTFPQVFESAKLKMPFSLGSGGITTSPTLSMTTSTKAPAGGAIIVAVGLGNGDGVLSVTDSASNTYSLQNNASIITHVNVVLAICPFCKTLPAGGTISGSVSTASGNESVAAAAIYCPGVIPTASADGNSVSSSTANATAASTISSGTLLSPFELAVGVAVVGGNAGAWTPGGSFSNINSTSVATLSLLISAQIARTTGSINFSPSWSGGSLPWQTGIFTFKAY